MVQAPIKGIMNKQPKYYIRPDDNEIFSINPDKTYSIEKMKTQYPNSFTWSYTGELLARLGFIPSNICTTNPSEN